MCNFLKIFTSGKHPVTPSPILCVRISVVTGILGSDTFWLLLSLLPAHWKIRIWPTSKGLHRGAHRVSFLPGSVGTLGVIMQVIINQQAAAFRTSSQLANICTCGFLPERAGPRAHQTRELHTITACCSRPLKQLFQLVLRCSPGSPVGVWREMYRLESVCSTQRAFRERTVRR